MKRLNIGFCNDNSRLQKRLLDYLLNAGHIVEVILLKELDTVTANYDYLIDISNQGCDCELPTLHLSASLSSELPDNLDIKWLLSQGEKTACLGEKKFNFSSDRLDEAYEVIQELFIDSFILLVRESDLIKQTSVAVSETSEFLKMEYFLDQLAHRYAELAKNFETVFLPARLLDSSPANDYHQRVIESIVLEAQELEWLIIYLLITLNGRSEGLYVYDFISLKQVLTKYAVLTLDSSYLDVFNQMMFEEYSVLSNQFFTRSVSPEESGLSKAQVAVQYGESKVSTDGYVLVLSYDPQKKLLKIHYDARLYFFGYVDQLIQNFQTYLSSFKARQIRLYEWLCEGDNFFEPVKLGKQSQSKEDFLPIHAYFERRVVQCPDQIALIYGSEQLTYDQLNQRANALADFLMRQYKLQPDEQVLLFLDRGINMVVGMLAVLKAGSAYVPIDIQCPTERLLSILTEVDPKAVLIEKGQLEELQALYSPLARKQAASSWVVLDHFFQEEYTKYSPNNPLAKLLSRHLAYVIYTSGTTGAPKGVMIEHAGLSNFVLDHAQIIQPTDVFLSYLNYAFDAFNTELYLPLIHGNTLHILDSESRLNLEYFYQYLLKHGVTFVVLPAVVAGEFLSKYDLSILALRTVITGGEVYRGSLDKKNICLINAYGPTEATVCTTWHFYKSRDNRSNIGQPLKNVTCYIVDDHCQLLPPGVIGQLCIGGIGVARGYLKNPQLTQQAFLNNPFQTKSERQRNMNSHIYQTGDRVRVLENGDLEYIGRLDQQVKINGYRIELKEIESVIQGLPRIQQALVIAHSKNNLKYLVAYYVASSPLDSNFLIESLKKQLPAYMVPVKMVYLEKIPMTRNGKIDFSALPLEIHNNEYNYEPPANPQELLICKVFEEVLNVKSVGALDHFFQLGGNSINAIRVLMKLQDHFEIKLSDVLSTPVPRELARKIPVSKSTFIKKLELVQRIYERARYLTDEEIALERANRQRQFLTTWSEKDYSIKKPIQSVLLTGSTGFLGINILYQLLTETSYQVHVLLRGESLDHAIDRLEKHFFHYFCTELSSFSSRLQCHFQSPSFQTMKAEHKALAAQVDSIIHVAALVKHHGEPTEFYQANIEFTKTMLELSKQTRLKDFHYMSTTAPLWDASPVNDQPCCFDEEDDIKMLEPFEGIYAKTKYEAENLVKNARRKGLTAQIYRLGNLAFMRRHQKIQKNSQDSAFYNWLLDILQLGCVALPLSKVDVTPVDDAARAIVCLFDKQALTQQTFHIFNSSLFDLSIVKAQENKNLEVVSIQIFLERVKNEIKSNRYESVERLLLRQGWLEDNFMSPHQIYLLQDKTEYMLKKCGFEWAAISSVDFAVFVNHIRSHLKR